MPPFAGTTYLQLPILPGKWDWECHILGFAVHLRCPYCLSCLEFAKGATRQPNRQIEAVACIISVSLAFEIWKQYCETEKRNMSAVQTVARLSNSVCLRMCLVYLHSRFGQNVPHVMIQLNTNPSCRKW